MYNIIKTKLEPSGGTNFFAVKQANDFINENLDTGLCDIINYVMSDGEHMGSGSEYTREKLMATESQIYTYCLGIGSSTQYDKELLTYFSKNFIGGYDEDVINDSIVGDTFGCMALIAKNVEISVITTAKTIKSSQEIVSISNNVEIDVNKYVNTNQIKAVQTFTDEKCFIKLISDSAMIKPLQKKTVMVFNVDISASMSSSVEPEVAYDVKPAKKKKSVQEKPIEINSLVQSDVKTYNKFTLAPINKFYTYNESYFQCITDEPIYFEIKLEDEIIYCLVDSKPELFTVNDIQVSELYNDLMGEYYKIKSLKDEEKIDFIKDLGLLVGSPKYNKIYKNIVADQNPSRICMYLMATINQIKKLVSKTKRKSDRLLDEMLAATPMDIVRAVSSTASRQYSSPSQDEPSYSIPLVPIASANSYDNENNTCRICFTNNREIIYDCGHCIACTKCTKQIFFNIDEDVELTSNFRAVSAQSVEPNQQYQLPLFAGLNQSFHSKQCPVCKKEVASVKLALSIDDKTPFKCIRDDCSNMAQYISDNCGHITYCKHCWNYLKKHQSLKCKCNEPITSYISIFT
jgi:hypothetical protein